MGNGIEVSYDIRGNGMKEVKEMAEVKIVLQDRDNYGEVLGVLTVKDRSKTETEIRDYVTEAFRKYQAEVDLWTVEGFVEYLDSHTLKLEGECVEYESTNVFSMEL